MADPSVEIKIKADAASAKTDINDVGQSVDGLADKQTGAANAASAGADKQADASRKVRDSLKDTGQAVDTLADKQTGAANAASAGADKQVASHRRIRDGVESISTQLDTLRNQVQAVFGVQVGAQLLKDLAQTADAYSGLAARIKLVTGEGEGFTTAMEGVQRIAVATRSDLEATGTLFYKISEVGKSLNLSQRQVLALTETINQTIQISGGSAQSAEAAIIQLVQGLQSGVLRGEEFNSVMEQSPRLAKALADGLGVSTGELRKMAEQGRLTSETVINALRGQSDTVASEFAKLPPTVGGALQNLSTAWTVYVGETDKAMDLSRRAAAAIDFLAQNLNEIGSVLLTAGKGVAALYALNLAQKFGEWALATKVAATETAAATTKTVEHTAATRADTVAVELNTAAKQANAQAATGALGAVTGLTAEISNATKAKAAAAEKAGMLATGWGLLKGAGSGLIGLMGGPVGLLVLTATYAKDLGELAAKLVLKARGMKTAEESAADMARADAEARQRSDELKAALERKAQAAKVAEAAQLGLGTSAQKLVEDFEKVIKDGGRTDEALKKIGKDFDLSNVRGIKDAASVLDALAQKGQITAEQFKAAWAEALKGQDLALFETHALTAFSGAARGAERTAQVMDATLRESIRRAGFDFDAISGGMSRAAASALNDTDRIVRGLDVLKQQGVDTGTLLAASLGRAIKTADSQAAIDEVRRRVEALRVVLGERQTNDLFDQIRTKATELNPQLAETEAAFRRLGITAQSTLERMAKMAEADYERIRASGDYTALDLERAWRRVTDAQAAASGRVVQASNEAAGSASALTDRLVEVGDSARSIDRATESVGGLRRELGAAANQAERLSGIKYPVITSNTLDNIPEFESVAEADAWMAENRSKIFFKGGSTLGAAANAWIQGEFDEQRKALVRKEARATQNGAVAGASAAPSSVPVNIFIDGVSTRVNVSTTSDAAALQSVLRELGSAAGRFA